MMKRLGLVAIVVALLVVGIEGTLALLRQRTISVTITLKDSMSGTATPAPAGVATPDPAPTTLSLLSDGTVLAHVTWTYHIGPRFPLTNIRAVVFDEKQQPVAADTYKLDCGSATIDCTGTAALSLNYGVQDKTGTRTLWPLGTYTLLVTRAYADLNATQLEQRTFEVVGR
jgi:hypothetical protein